MQAIFTRFSSRVDGAVGFGGCTPELTTVEKCTLFDLQNKNVRILIEPMDYEPESKITVKAEISIKSPSERLRGILFLEYREKGIDGVFDSYYFSEMEKIIDQRKALL